MIADSFFALEEGTRDEVVTEQRPDNEQSAVEKTSAKKDLKMFFIKNTSSLVTASLLLIFNFSSCYSFKDVTIAPEVKTAKVNYFTNRASYVNPQFSPALTEKLRQKINGQTRLTLVQADDAHYDISGYITQYMLTTSGIANQQAATNRLVVTVHLIFKNRLDEKANFETDLSRNFDFDASLSLQQAEAQKGDEIVRNMTDEIFNRIFSNW